MPFELKLDLIFVSFKFNFSTFSINNEFSRCFLKSKFNFDIFPLLFNSYLLTFISFIEIYEKSIV